MAGGHSDLGTDDAVLTWSSTTVDSGAFYGIWYAGDGSRPPTPSATRRGGRRHLEARQRRRPAQLRQRQRLHQRHHAALGLRLQRDVWASGDSATIWHKTGTGWMQLRPRPTALEHRRLLKGIWVGSPGTPSLHAVGGTINGNCADPAIDAHYNGTNWMAGSVASGCAFSAVWGNRLGFIAWVGNEHKLIFTTDDHAATEFTYIPQVTSNIYFYGIWGVSKGQMWTVGDGGTIFKVGIDKFNNGSFQAETSNTTAQLNAVSGTGPSDLWAVGIGGDVLHSNGDGNWTKQTNVGNAMQSSTASSRSSPTDVYIVGSRQRSEGHPARPVAAAVTRAGRS